MNKIVVEHSNQKSLCVTIVKCVKKLESQLCKSRSDLTSAGNAIEETRNSSSKRIKNVLLDGNLAGIKALVDAITVWLEIKILLYLKVKKKGTLASADWL